MCDDDDDDAAGMKRHAKYDEEIFCPIQKVNIFTNILAHRDQI